MLYSQMLEMLHSGKLWGKMEIFSTEVCKCLLSVGKLLLLAATIFTHNAAGRHGVPVAHAQLIVAQFSHF